MTAPWRRNVGNPEGTRCAALSRQPPKTPKSRLATEEKKENAVSRGQTLIYKTLPESWAVQAGVQSWDTTAIDATASPEGFDMPGIALVAGRRFTEADISNKLETDKRRSERGSIGSVAIINQALAHELWPGENAVGNVFYAGAQSHEVVGVVRNYHQKPAKK